MDTQNTTNLPFQFPSLKGNAGLVEQARLPRKVHQKSRIQNPVPHFGHNTPGGTSRPILASYAASNSTKSQAASQQAHTSSLPQWQLQVICGPGHDHQNFDSQRAGTKFKAFELIGKQIWRPSSIVLDEPVQSPNTDSSLDWPDFLQFRVLEETTPWEHWYGLYSKEHYGRKPLMPDCYITHRWNKQAKTPIWLPREVRNTGTLRSVLEKCFPLAKDKVTIIFEYINKDQAQFDSGVAEQLRNLSFELSDHELPGPVTSDTNSPASLPVHQSLSSYELNSSPPLVADNNTPYMPSESILISSFDSEFPSIQELIALTPAAKSDAIQTLSSITLGPPAKDLPSSPLSTIPDSPEIPSAPHSIVNNLSLVTQIPSRTTSKVVYPRILFICSPS